MVKNHNGSSHVSSTRFSGAAGQVLLYDTHGSLGFGVAGYADCANGNQNVHTINLPSLQELGRATWDINAASLKSFQQNHLL